MALLALFGFIGQIAVLTGLRFSVIHPAAEAISKVTGLSENGATVLAVGVAAFGLMKMLAAIGRVAIATASRR